MCVSIPGHGGCKLTGGLTLLNPLLGVLRMMMWAVDTPWWFHFLRASRRSQTEKLWGYYKVRGWLTLNMKTIPCWHFHFLKRPIPIGGQMCLLIFVQITFTLLFRSNICLKQQYGLCPAFHSYRLESQGKFSGFPRHTHAWNQTVPIIHECVFQCHFFSSFHFVLQTPSEVQPCSQPVGVTDVFNGTWFVS